jgi:hypothetical protein
VVRHDRTSRRSSVDAEQPTGASSTPQVSLQASLFDDLPAEERPGGHPVDVGYRGPTA